MASHTKTIKLSGSLGRRFGVFHKLAVDSVAECIRALSYQVEGFKPFMQSKVGSNMRFGIVADGKPISTDDFATFAVAKEIRIIPIPRARKNGGWFKHALWYRRGRETNQHGRLCYFRRSEGDSNHPDPTSQKERRVVADRYRRSDYGRSVLHWRRVINRYGRFFVCGFHGWRLNGFGWRNADDRPAGWW
nr:tail protein [Klebsiella phage vB_Kpn_K46PH129]